MLNPPRFVIEPYKKNHVSFGMIRDVMAIAANLAVPHALSGVKAGGMGLPVSMPRQ